MRLLLVDDRAARAERLVAALRAAGVDPEWERVGTEAECIAALDRHPDVVVITLPFAACDAVGALGLLRERDRDVPLVVVADALDADVAVECMRRGADDCLSAERLEKLPQALERALEAGRRRVEARRLDAERHQVEARYRLIIEHVNDAIFLIDLEGRLLFVSPRVIEMTGYGQELLGQSALHLFTPEGRRLILERLARVRRSEPVPNLFEAELVRRDGSRLWVEASLTSIIEGGRVVGRLGVARDITARKQARDAAQRREREARALAEVASLVSRSLDPREVGQLVVDSVCDLLEAQTAALYRVTPSGQAVLTQFVQRAGLAPYWSPTLQPGEGVVGFAIGEGRAVTTIDAITDARVRYGAAARQRLEGLAHRAFVAVPLRVHDRLLGALIVADHSGRHFGPREADIAQAFADHVGIAIQNADLFTASERRAARMQTLVRLIQEVSASLEPTRVLNAVARAAAELTGAPLAVVWLFDERRGLVTLAGASDEARISSFPVRELAVENTVAGTVARDRRRRIVADVADVDTVPELVARDWLREHGFRSIIADPIVADDRTVGVLSLVGVEPFRLDADEDALLGAFRVEAAIALQNAELHASAQRELAERRRIEQALRDTTEHMRTLIDASPLAVVTYDRDARVILWNPAAEALFGWSADEARGRALPPVPPEHETLAAAVRAGVRAGEVFQALEMSLCRRDRGVVETVSSSAPLRDDAGRVVGAVVVIADVTARKRTEAALRQSEKLAVMGSLLAGVAHELNNPLAVVLGQAHLLSHQVAGHPAVVERVGKLASAADRCARVVRNFLALARQRPPERRDVALNEVVVEAVELFSYPLRVDGIAIDLGLSPSLPTLRADRDQLHQIAVNLLTNAQHAMRGAPDPRRLTVTTEYDADAARVTLQVADTGPGIPAEILPRLFEPFFTTKPVGEGTGLGLSLCRGFVEAHGGTIEALNRPHGGAVFRVALPVGNGDASRDDLASPPARPGLRILVVDDEVDVAEVLAELLDADGHRVEITTSAAAALELLSRSSVDVVFTDLRMPGMDGAAFYREAVGRRAELAGRFVFVTGDALSAETSRFLAEGRVTTVEKPFDLHDVRRALAALLR